MRVFIIGKPIQEEGLYVYNLHDIAEEHFSISIASLRLLYKNLSLSSMDVVKGDQRIHSTYT
jgi:hypothetical protein